jgi:predicted aspartyl protease
LLLGRFVAEFEEPLLPFRLRSTSPFGDPLDLKGLIDTGANRLVIPMAAARHSRLRQVDEIELKSASHNALGAVFLARVSCERLEIDETIEVVAPIVERDDIPVLIGMSLLRRFNIFYNGQFGTWSFYARD